MKRTIKVRKERYYRPHTEFYHAISVHLKHVKAQQPGCYYSLLSAFLLSAFTLEAYLNYVGPMVERGWEDFDRSSPLAKLRHVACLLGLSLKSSTRPLQTIVALFSFRNCMAHPRALPVVEEYSCTLVRYESDFYKEPRPPWMAFATEQNACRCYEDVGALIELINSKLPLPETLPLHDSGWSGSASAAESK